MYTAFASGLRKEIADGFRAEDSVVRVIVATVAFGMGIDCMGVWQVIHVTCPETGRCGRDGQYSEATLFGKLAPTTGPAMRKWGSALSPKYTL